MEGPAAYFNPAWLKFLTSSSTSVSGKMLITYGSEIIELAGFTSPLQSSDVTFVPEFWPDTRISALS